MQEVVYSLRNRHRCYIVVKRLISLLEENKEFYDVSEARSLIRYLKGIAVNIKERKLTEIQCEQVLKDTTSFIEEILIYKESKGEKTLADILFSLICFRAHLKATIILTPNTDLL